jgi:hypothetical protein
MSSSNVSGNSDLDIGVAGQLCHESLRSIAGERL